MDPIARRRARRSATLDSDGLPDLEPARPRPPERTLSFDLAPEESPPLPRECMSRCIVRDSIPLKLLVDRSHIPVSSSSESRLAACISSARREQRIHLLGTDKQTGFSARPCAAPSLELGSPPESNARRAAKQSGRARSSVRAVKATRRDSSPRTTSSHLAHPIHQVTARANVHRSCPRRTLKAP